MSPPSGVAIALSAMLAPFDGPGLAWVGVGWGGASSGWVERPIDVLRTQGGLGGRRWMVITEVVRHLGKEQTHMTRIRATCPDCGNVEFGVTDIVVVGAHEGTTRTYRFACPCCDRPVHRFAEPDIIDLLLSVGVPVEQGLAAPIEHVDGPASQLPPLTETDIDRFASLLETRDWFARLEPGAAER